MEGRPLDDADPGDLELVERARGGDLDAYGILVGRYQGMAHRVAWLVTRDSAEAEDAVQEAFVKAYSALSRFRSDASFKPWLLTIVGNEARNRRRSAGRRAALVVRARAASPEASSPETSSPESLALAEERRRALAAALDRLNDADRLVISYRYLLEMSEADTAAALGIARGTVKSRLSRALTRLRNRLDPGVLGGAP